MKSSPPSLWLLGAVVAFMSLLATPALAAPVTWGFSVPLYEAGPAKPDTACGFQASSTSLETVVECEVNVWRVSHGDTLIVRMPCSRGDSMNVVTELAGGTYYQGWTRTRDAAGHWSCVGAKVMLAVPATEFTPGVQGYYFRDTNLTDLADNRTEPTIDFNWGGGSPSPSITTDSWSARWEGFVTASATGTYGFRVLVNDATRLWIGSTKVLDDWSTGDAEHSINGSIVLQGGVKYPIRAEMFERKGSARMTLYWTQPGQPEEVVPAVAFTQ